MRYLAIPDIKFVDIYGTTKIMHGARMAERFSNFSVQTKPLEMELDDFAVQLWGQGMEIFSYRLREQNIERMLLANFDERQLSDIMVPPED